MSGIGDATLQLRFRRLLVGRRSVLQRFQTRSLYRRRGEVENSHLLVTTQATAISV